MDVSYENTPSSRRPLPFRRRGDLVVQRIGFQGSGYWVVKDPVALKYHRLKDEQYTALEMLDGERSLHTLRQELVREYPTARPSLTDVQRLVTDLHEKGLVVSDRVGQGPALVERERENRWKEFWQKLRGVLFLRLPGFDPERLLQWMLPFTRWVFHPAIVVLMLLFVASSMVLLAVDFQTFQSKLPEFQVFFAWPNLLYMWLAIAATKLCHEFGHGLSCKHYGSECHSIGVMLLVFSPTLYCDTSDSWMLKSKWQRMAIGAAGMYFEVIISAIAMWLWWFTEDGLLHHLCLNVFFVTSVSVVIFNLNPLMRFDGYYILSDYLEIPNLRPKSDAMFRQTLGWWCLGIERRPDPFEPQHGRGWFVLYSICSTIYSWFLVLSITLFLYTVLKPYDLQSIGILVACLSVGALLSNSVTNLYKTFTTPREEPLSRRKIAVTLAVIAGVLTAVMFVPLPWYLEAPFVLEARGVTHVHATTPGRLAELQVAEGAVVDPDDPLFVLENVDLRERLDELHLELDFLEAQLETRERLNAPAEEESIAASIARTAANITELERQMTQLVVHAPIGGRVVAPEARPEPRLDETARELNGWYGTPLEERNLGAAIEAGTPLCSIAPDDTKWDAVLYLDQSIRNDLRADQSVQLKFDELPFLKPESTVGTISDRHDAFVPRALSNKYGGELPTLTDDQGRERLTDVAYRIVVPVPAGVDPQLLRTGLRGRARFLVRDRTVGQWVWRFLRRTFTFDL